MIKPVSSMLWGVKHKLIPVNKQAKSQTMYSISAHLYNQTSGFDNPENISTRLHCALLDGDIASQGRALDIGCGTGEISGYMAQQGWRITGLDNSTAMLAIAKNTPQPIFWRQGDATEADTWKSLDTYQAAWAMCNTINHFAPESLSIVFQGVYSVLEDGGVWVFDTDTYRMFQECLDHEAITVWEDSTQRMIRACQFDSLTAQAHHTTRLEYLKDHRVERCQDEHHTLYYHPEHYLADLAKHHGFDILAAEPLNPFDDDPLIEDDEEAVYKLLWTLKKK